VGWVVGEWERRDEKNDDELRLEPDVLKTATGDFFYLGGAISI
jgi:hypothetical protein